MVDKSDEFDEWLSIVKLFLMKILLFIICEHMTLTFVKVLLVKVLYVLHSSKFSLVMLYGVYAKNVADSLAGYQTKHRQILKFSKFS